MADTSRQPATANHSPFLLILLCMAVLAFYQVLIHNYPVVYWGDAHVRLGLRDQILVGHWLPLIQFLIFLVSRFDAGLIAIRTVLSMVAAGTMIAMYYLGQRLFSGSVGLVAAAFLSVNLMFVALAIVPYPEVLFAGLVFLALATIDHPISFPRSYVGIIALNLACLTRYEGWLLAGVIVVEAVCGSLRSGRWRTSLPDVSRTAILSSIAPLAWLIFGVKEPGGVGDQLKAIFVFETAITDRSLLSHFLSSISGEYLQAFLANYFHILNWQTGMALIVLGIGGFFYAIKFARSRACHWRILAFVILDVLLLAFWQPQDFTSLRTAFIGEIFLILYAAYGMDQLIRGALRKFASPTGNTRILNGQGLVLAGAVTVVMTVSIPAAVNLVKTSSHEANFYVPAQAGSWLMKHVTPNDVVWVLGDDALQAYALATYSQLPLDVILDGRLDDQTIRSRLNAAEFVYIVSIYNSTDDMATLENAVYHQLDSGQIEAERIPVDRAVVWKVETSGLQISP